MTRKEMALREEVLSLFKRRVLVTKSAVRTASRVLKASAEANPTRRKHEYWCSNCGGKFATPLDEPHVCPHCGARLTYHHDKCRLSFKSEQYLKELVTYGGWQVLKEYVVDAKHRSGKAVEYDVKPVYTWWHNPEKHATLLYTRPILMFPGWCRIPFSTGSGFVFRRTKVSDFWHNGWEDTLVGGSKVLDYYRERGIDSMEKHPLEDLLSAFTAEGTILETLVKTRQDGAVDLFISDPRYRAKLIRYWRSWVLARRHGFDIGHVGERLFLDYLDNLKMLKRDLRNPFFICPANFAEAHAEAARRCARILERRQDKAARTRHLREQIVEAERLARDAEAVAEFERRMLRYYKFAIRDNEVSILPIMSIEEFRAEGEAMQHCVYSNRYFARPECLILSARRVADGSRLETVEVSLRNWNVVQSRAFKNGTTPYHDRIVSLVTEAMPRIKAYTKRPIKQTA